MIMAVYSWGKDIKNNSQKKIDKLSLNILKSLTCTSN